MTGAVAETVERRPRPPARWSPPTPSRWSLPLSLPAQLYVEHDAAIYARSSGIVEAILVDLGSRVTAGQLLGAAGEHRSDHRPRPGARAARATPVVQAERQRALKTAGVVTQADSERVELELREATLALQKAQRDYDLTRIVAPFGGVVTGRTARIGRLVGDGRLAVSSHRA